MELFQIDDDARLFISPAIDDWRALESHQIEMVIDLEGGLDNCIPTIPERCLYIYFPIFDEELPNLAKLFGIARLGASLISEGHPVLVHCGMGFNRSALVAGLILTELGMPGSAAVVRLRERRPGALFNDRFAGFLETISPSAAAL
jgi:protein-tyrosine phosphatase